MSIIKQERLFEIQELFDLEPPNVFEAIFSTLDIEPILFCFLKIRSLVARIIERIPTVKALRKRLKHYFIFHAYKTTSTVI
ncbi:hypothetical protein JNUCC42_17625 [Brevibacterium sp. JNUCC-42]|nr:hypothetical protein JNUCC42_17625 [Brevibacterium sp. JNUCC-42]